MPGSYAGAGDLDVDSHAHPANTLPTEPSLQSLDPICLNIHRYNSVPESVPVYKYATIFSATEHWNLSYTQFLCDYCCSFLVFSPCICCFFAGHVSWCRGSIISLDGNASDHFVCIDSPLLSKVKFLLHHGFSSLDCCPLCGCFTQLKQ